MVTGTLSKAGGTFRIDHPLEPERRYLVHGFVEAPEQLNVYRGTVKLNARDARQCACHATSAPRTPIPPTR